jgi:hypothetical protein
MTSVVNRSLMQLQRRAESVRKDTLATTFVNVGPLLDLLWAKNHQILFGRRGTGKTHALSALAAQAEAGHDIVVMIDLRMLDAAGAYGNRSLPLADRATLLLRDMLAALHDSLTDSALEMDSKVPLQTLDHLAEAITTVEVQGNVERESKADFSSDMKDDSGFELGLSSSGPTVGFKANTVDSTSSTVAGRVLETGVPYLEISFGSVFKSLQRITETIAPNTVWILIDEWSSLPPELQPILADLIRRTLLPVPMLIVKIAAIEDRSVFRARQRDPGYVGLELGSDIAADISLDELLATTEDEGLKFYSDLFYGHVSASLPTGTESKSQVEFIREAFAGSRVLREIARASENIPRDGINIAALAARRANDNRITIVDVRRAAREWYQRDKLKALRDPGARELLNTIVEEVVGKRRRRAFLLREDVAANHPDIRVLYDERLIHSLRRGVSSADMPTTRFDGFAVDYGNYVEFISADDDHRPRLQWTQGARPTTFSVLKDDVLELAPLSGKRRERR